MRSGRSFHDKAPLTHGNTWMTALKPIITYHFGCGPRMRSSSCCRLHSSRCSSSSRSCSSRSRDTSTSYGDETSVVDGIPVSTQAASFDGLRPLLVACHCQPFCSLANKLRSFARSLWNEKWVGAQTRRLGYRDERRRLWGGEEWGRVFPPSHDTHTIFGCFVRHHVRRKVPTGYNVVRPKFVPKVPLPVDRSQTALPASSLDPSDLSGSDPPLFHNALDRPAHVRTHIYTDRQIVHGEVWSL